MIVGILAAAVGLSINAVNYFVYDQVAWGAFVKKKDL